MTCHFNTIKASRSADDRGQLAMETCVTVIIVNYNAGPVLKTCVASVLDQVGQVVVVDNASSDDSLERLRDAYPDDRRLKIVCNPKNVGFATGCNIGARIGEGLFFLFLNPDCWLSKGALGHLVAALHAQPKAGMAGGLLLDPDGNEQRGGRRAIPTPQRAFARAFGLSRLMHGVKDGAFSDFNLHRLPLPQRPIAVDAISGACMLVRREAIDAVGLLDEGYFLHCEDLDWCMRFRRKGWQVLFVPDARVVHAKGTCSHSRPVFVEWHKHRGMMRFYRKFFRRQYSGALMALVATGVWIHFLAVAGYHVVNNRKWTERRR